MGGESTAIKTICITIERKTFVIEFGTNAQGDYVKIIENSSNRKNMVVMPASGLVQLRDVLDKHILERMMAKAGQS